MNRKLPYDQVLILIVLALVGFGLVMVFSSSSQVSAKLYGSPTGILTRQLVSTLLGLLFLMATMRVDYHVYQKAPVALGLAALTVAMLLAALAGPEINGAHRWIDLGPANFQPSELAKPVVVLLTALFLFRCRPTLDLWDRRNWYFPVLSFLIIVLVLLGPDLGTAATLAIIVALLLFVGGLSLKYYLGTLLLSIPAFYLLVYSVSYRRERILAFLDPRADPQGNGYQLLQSLMAVGSGGISGKGLAQGTRKLFFLPEIHTDFIYAVIGEELGLIGCVTVVLLFALLFWRGVRIALRADNLFGSFLALGLVSMIVLQAFLNISVVLGLVPTKGIPLPFVSVGGSSILVMLASTGVLLNISRHTRGQMTLTQWTQAQKQPGPNAATQKTSMPGEFV